MDDEPLCGVRGYPIGPIDAKGAFTSEIDLPPMKPGPLNMHGRLLKLEMSAR